MRWDDLMGINSQVDRNTMINTPMIRNASNAVPPT
jgi:hypothetical protein